MSGAPQESKVVRDFKKYCSPPFLLALSHSFAGSNGSCMQAHARAVLAPGTWLNKSLLVCLRFFHSLRRRVHKTGLHMQQQSSHLVLGENERGAVAVAAIHALTTMIKESGASTIMELEILLKVSHSPGSQLSKT
eukprot:3094799-Rhodomonas_salina.1